MDFFMCALLKYTNLNNKNIKRDKYIFYVMKYSAKECFEINSKSIEI